MTASKTTEPNLPLDPCRGALGRQIADALNQMQSASETPFRGADIGRLLEKPPEAKLGDYALPCFRFAKNLKRKPPEVAAELAVKLTQTVGGVGHWVTRTEVVGAFLNIFIDQPKLASAVIPDVLSGAWFERLKDARAAQGAERVMIEYSQPNTHKEFHVGHSRNVCLGSSLVRLYRYCGYHVTAANYLGDEGTHIATILWYLSRTKAEPPEVQKGEWLGKMYVRSKKLLADAPEEERQTMLAEISAVHRAIESKAGETYQLWLKTRQWSLDEFDDIYRWLGIDFDILFYESQVSEESQQIVDEFLAKGIFTLDDGAIGVDLKPYKLGFCILRKRDGNTLYATKDLALARRKFEQYNIDRSIYVVADEQNHHFRQVFKVLELMGFEQAKRCYHLSYGMVVLPEGKMSSRDGTSVTFNELKQSMMDEIHLILKKYEGDWTADELRDTAHKLVEGALKYGMLSVDPKSEIVFVLQDWLSFEGNSGPYLMYGYARTQSILRKAAEIGALPDAKHVALLAHPTEQELVRFIYDFNETAAEACENLKPSTLATHLFYMCKSFNRFFAEVSVLKAESEDLRGARLALTAAFSTTLKQGLTLLGIRPPNRM